MSSDKFSPPAEVTYQGQTYYRTGKVGHVAATGVPSAEYRLTERDGRRTDERLWLDANGKIYED